MINWPFKKEKRGHLHCPHGDNKNAEWQCCFCGKTYRKFWRNVPDPDHGPYVEVTYPEFYWEVVDEEEAKGT